MWCWCDQWQQMSGREEWKWEMVSSFKKQQPWFDLYLSVLGEVVVELPWGRCALDCAIQGNWCLEWHHHHDIKIWRCRSLRSWSYLSLCVVPSACVDPVFAPCHFLVCSFIIRKTFDESLRASVQAVLTLPGFGSPCVYWSALTRVVAPLFWGKVLVHQCAIPRVTAVLFAMRVSVYQCMCTMNSDCLLFCFIMRSVCFGLP